MLIPELINTVSSLIKMLPDFAKQLDSWWSELKVLLEHYNIVLPSLDFDMSRVLETVNNFISNYGEKFINTTVNITTTIVTFIVNLVLAIVFSIYLLSQKETIGKQVKKVLYAVFRNDRVTKLLDVASLSNQSFSRFVAGQLLEAVIIGILCFIGMLIFRMPYAGVISVLVGFTALIPVFGAFIGTAVGAFLILLVNPMKALWFIVFIIVLQQVEGNLIYPKVVGKSVGLPGIWVLVAVTVGGGAFGIPGMLFGVPVCSVLYVLLKDFVTKRNREEDVSVSVEDEETAEENQK
jgi:predicted PurR-regulated permease PerM